MRILILLFLAIPLGLETATGYTYLDLIEGLPRFSEEVDAVLDPPRRPVCPGSRAVDDNEFLHILPDILKGNPLSIPTPDERGRYPETFYEQLKNAARPLQNNLNACLGRLEGLYEEHSVWKDLTRPQRARATLAIIRQEVRRLRNANKLYTKKEEIDRLLKDNKPLPPLIDEDTMACIAWKENKSYYPEAVNYSFCEPWNPKFNNPYSLAHGLGQITSKTFRDLHEGGHFYDYLPEYNDDRKIRLQRFYAINNRPVLQIRIAILTLNEKRGWSGSLDNAILNYNSKPCYPKFINYCKACLRRARSGGENSESQLIDCMLREEPKCSDL